VEPDSAGDEAVKDLVLKAAAASHTGRRPRQEDSFLALARGGSGVVAVADGMGGHAAGEVASRIAIERLAASAQAAVDRDPRDLLREAAETANSAILAHADAQPDAVGLGTTLVAALVCGHQAVIGHAGDSRAFLVTGDGLTQLTRDHSAVQDAVDRGTLTASEVAAAPFRHAIVRSLGDEAFPGLEYTPAEGSLEVPDGAILLLTSDGAHGVLTPAEILDHLAGTPTLKRGLDQLLRLAYARGSDDNITLAGCEVGLFPRSRIRTAPPPPLPAPRVSPRKRPFRILGPALISLLALLAALLVAVGFEIARDRTTRPNLLQHRSQPATQVQPQATVTPAPPMPSPTTLQQERPQGHQPHSPTPRLHQGTPAVRPATTPAVAPARLKAAGKRGGAR
jgi:protein phosphatase